MLSLAFPAASTWQAHHMARVKEKSPLPLSTAAIRIRCAASTSNNIFSLTSPYCTVKASGCPRQSPSPVNSSFSVLCPGVPGAEFNSSVVDQSFQCSILLALAVTTTHLCPMLSSECPRIHVALVLVEMIRDTQGDAQ